MICGSFKNWIFLNRFFHDFFPVFILEFSAISGTQRLFYPRLAHPSLFQLRIPVVWLIHAGRTPWLRYNSEKKSRNLTLLKMSFLKWAEITMYFIKENENFDFWESKSMTVKKSKISRLFVPLVAQSRRICLMRKW